MATLVFHLDLDSFFVSAERLRSPKLRGAVMAVGHEGPRGVITSASYEARRHGIRSAMPTAQALRLFPRLVLVEPDIAYYVELSKQVFAITLRFSPVQEQVSIDEAYLEMSGSASLFGSPREAARKIRESVHKEAGLSASIGIASNKLVAKVASDYAKPDALFEVPTGGEAAFFAPLEVGKIPGIGRVTQEWLNQRGIRTLGQLQAFPVDALERQFGRIGTWLHEASHGLGAADFHEPVKNRGISREETFGRDEADRSELVARLWSMCAELGRELRADDVWARGVKLKLRYPPFETLTRSRVLPAPTQSDRVLFEKVEALFLETWDSGRPVRLVGAGCSIGDSTRQFGLFEDTSGERRQEELQRLRDELREKFGTKAAMTGKDFG